MLVATAPTTGPFTAGVVTVTGSGSSALVIDGTYEQIAFFLNAHGDLDLAGILYYFNNSDTPSNDTLTVTVNDLGNTGIGGPLTVTDTMLIINDPVNDAPVATITPTTYSATEQIPLTLKGTGLSISDVDADQGTMTVIISVTAGTLSASAGTIGVGVSGSGTSSLTLTGTVAQINTLLAAGGDSTLSYVNNSDSSATLTMTVHDNGWTGYTPFLPGLTASDTAIINVTPVNDAPVAVADTGSAGENETKSFDVLANDTDADTGDTKALTSLGAITVTSANASVNGINASSAFAIVGNQIQFTPGTLFDALDFNDAASVAVNYTMQDSQGAPSSSTLTLTVNGANDAPVAVANTGSAGENETKSFAVLANDTDVDLGDTKTLTTLGAITVTSANASINGINASSAFTIVAMRFSSHPVLYSIPWTSTIRDRARELHDAGQPRSAVLVDADADGRCRWLGHHPRPHRQRYPSKHHNGKSPD